MIELARLHRRGRAGGIRARSPSRCRREPVFPGWEERWREFHRPVRAGGLWIGPPWETPPPGDPAVVVDPGRAFGTGAHATTRACIELLSELDRGSVLDAGTGSGVIAVAAATLGFAPVFALDSTRTRSRLRPPPRTETASRVDVRQADVLVAALPEVDLVVANIELRAVEALLARRPAPERSRPAISPDERPWLSRLGAVSRLELDGWAADLLAFSERTLLS